MTAEARVDEARRRVSEQSEPAEARFAFDARGEVVGEGDRLKRRAEDELPGVQDETLVGGVVVGAADLNEPGEIRLLGGRF